MPEHTTRIGHLLGPHGVSVGIKLYVLGAAEQLLSLKRVYVEGLGWTRLARLENHAAGLVITLGGVSERTSAETLRGRQVYAHDQELPPLPEGEYYYHELRGLPVRNAAGEVLGEVTDVQDAGHQDLLVVSHAGSQSLLPLQAPYVQVQRGRAIVLSDDVPAGLLGGEDSQSQDQQRGPAAADDTEAGN